MFKLVIGPIMTLYQYITTNNLEIRNIFNIIPAVVRPYRIICADCGLNMNLYYCQNNSFLCDTCKPQQEQGFQISTIFQPYCGRCNKRIVTGSYGLPPINVCNICAPHVEFDKLYDFNVTIYIHDHYIPQLGKLHEWCIMYSDENNNLIMFHTRSSQVLLLCWDADGTASFFNLYNIHRDQFNPLTFSIPEEIAEHYPYYSIIREQI